MKLIAAMSLALVLAGCGAQTARGAGAPRAESPAAQGQLQSCQRDLDCDGNMSCVEGYCRKVY
jgi:hypothetical protein